VLQAELKAYFLLTQTFIPTCENCKWYSSLPLGTVVSLFRDFAAITTCFASEQVFIVYFIIDSVRKLLDILSCFHIIVMRTNHLKMGSDPVAETS
jgi:hypothetical protein